MGLETGRQIANYIVERPLGGGGMATVYRVRHAMLESLHAMKVLAPELVVEADLRQRFLDEGKIQARLRHPNIVPVTELVAEPGIAALVMDHVDGPSLEGWLQAQETFPDPVVLRDIFTQVLAGLGFAHRQGIVHRDMKPANVLLQLEDGQPTRALVVDFGIAKMLESSKRATQTSAKMGTPYYMSPEQIRSAKGVDARSDVFSVGVAIYECATKAMPFEGDSDFDVQMAIVAGRFAPARTMHPGIDPTLEAVIVKAMATNPNERFQSCEEFARALAGAGGWQESSNRGSASRQGCHRTGAR